MTRMASRLNVKVTPELLESLGDSKAIADQLITRAMAQGANETDIEKAMDEFKEFL
jgi:hypothetical protein